MGETQKSSPTNEPVEIETPVEEAASQAVAAEASESSPAEQAGAVAEVIEVDEVSPTSGDAVEVDDGVGNALEVEDPTLELRAKIAELEAEVTRYDELYRQESERKLRVAADYENFKRRAERDKDDIRKFSNERIVLDMLPVLDNLDRALEHSANTEAGKSLVEGVEMVLRQFKQTLAKYGVESFDSVGEPFDPQRHEAVGQMPSADHEPNTVVQEYQRGYFLNGRLIRPAMVVVSRAAPVAEPAPPSDAQEGDKAEE